MEIPGIMVVYGRRAVVDLYYWVYDGGTNVAGIRITLTGTQYELEKYWEGEQWIIQSRSRPS